MSRCFPFPPPGYVVNGGGRDEALIESMKGAEEKGKKEHRRERKREKNDKKDKKDKKDKRDKKEKEEKKDKKDKKRKERERGEGESGKHCHKRWRKEEVAKDVQNHQSVNEYLEKSSLTVERELLQSTSQNSCDSTLNSNEKEKKQSLDVRHNNNDSTLNCNDLPKQPQPLDGGRHNNNDSESIIRIRLPIRRPKDPEVMMMITNKDQPCPSRDIKLDSVAREQPQRSCSTSTPEHVSKPHEEKRKKHTSKTKHKEKKLSSTTQETSQPPNGLCRFCPPSMVAQFLNVVENWVPNALESRVELSEDDECWWLMKKPSSHKFDKQVNRNNETKQVMSPWPRARLLPEADVYALPYTVPF